jgi:hypothetical protein
VHAHAQFKKRCVSLPFPLHSAFLGSELEFTVIVAHSGSLLSCLHTRYAYMQAACGTSLSLGVPMAAAGGARARGATSTAHINNASRSLVEYRAL